QHKQRPVGLHSTGNPYWLAITNPQVKLRLHPFPSSPLGACHHDRANRLSGYFAYDDFCSKINKGEASPFANSAFFIRIEVEPRVALWGIAWYAAARCDPLPQKIGA